MKTQNAKLTKWMRRASGLLATLMITMSFAGQASAMILFQDDTTHDIDSEGITVNADDGGDEDVTFQLGNDGTDATLTFDDGTGDLTIAAPTGSDVIVGSGTGLNFSGSDMFRIRENADPATNSACQFKGELIYDTTDDQLQICTATGAAGAATWVATSSSSDATTLDSLDSTQFLRSDTSDNFTSGTFTLDSGTTLAVNGTATIGDNGDTVTINSSDWDVSATGDMTGIGAITADGLITGTAGTTISGAASSINANSNFTTAINTGTSTGAVTIGGGANTVAIDTTSWDISSAGVGSGFTGFTSTGVVNFSGVSRLALHSGAANPVPCTEGDIFYNTGDNTTYICTVTGNPGTWTALSTGGADTFESVYAADGDKSLSVTDNLAIGFEIKEGANPYLTIVTTDGSESVQIKEDAVIGDNGDTVVINSSDWDVSATGDMTGIGAITMDGNFSQTGATTFGTGTGAVSLNGATTVANGSSFTANGQATLGDGGDTVSINSSDWDISTTGDISGVGTITADGLITGTAGATLSGAAVSLNDNSNFAVNVGTGTSTGAVAIGGGANTIAINSSAWDISAAGAASGFTTISASGNITTSGGTFVVGTTALNETTATNDSGAFLVGTFDEFDNSNSTNVQDVLDDLDALIGSNSPNVDTMVFEPMYPNYVLWADGTDNNGKMESLYDNTNREHYYRWTTTKNVLHDYDIRFRYTLPDDYSAAGNMLLRLRNDTTTAGDNAVAVTVRNDTDNATCHADGSVTATAANTWENVTITGAEIETGCTAGTALNPGDVIEVIIHMSASNSNSGGTDVGTLSFAYTN